jgi:acyl transferase domain-containing protein/NAD(P)-dependent dehydrogenase (short-subunit alcohol dehydrogenase family)/aryl carrier-like protein
MTAEEIDGRDDRPTAPAIAVIGMACRFPGADTPGEFWSLLRDGREAIRLLSDDELRAAGVPEALIHDPDYVKAGMHLRNMDHFDPAFFGFSPLDARILDPQHRHFLECAWEALEDAGYDPERFDGSIGVFAGSGHNSYLPYNLLTNPQLVADVGFFLLRHTGNDKDFLATRASYCFDLKGPSVNVQTACSTSLVAVHLAAQSLISGECEIALAGGVTIELPHHQGYLFKEGEILSRDGHCRPFDASAGGTVFGSGVGMVTLKLLDQAIADGDNIHAVVLSTAVNNDGAGKVSYLAPSVEGQAAAVQEALLVSGIDPQTVTFIETHGTGTQLGDPIEVAALRQVYAAERHPRHRCALGSVKSNIGHLDTAAGVASLIKVILAMKNRRIPATLHYRAPNEAIDFASGPFFVNPELQDWNAPSPLRAGVSSLGVGGTNAHAIVEEAPPGRETSAGRSHQLLLLSARTEGALSRSAARLAEFIRGEGDENLEDVAWTLAVGRRRFRQRAAFVASSQAEAAALLEEAARSATCGTEAPESERQVAFMFAGGGSQYPLMGRDLYQREPLFRSIVDECLQLVSPQVGCDLRSLLFPPAGSEEQAAAEMQRPSRSLPLLFTIQYAQARLWESWGVRPAAMIGHSMGENTAACLTGVFSLRDALGLVALRGQLFETLPEGGMLSVNLPAEEVTAMLSPELGIAARNAPELTVVSGPVDALDEFERTLAATDASYQRIRINVAAHSAMVEPVLKPFGDYLRSITLRPPTLPMLSNLTGTWMTPTQATDPEYWVQHLRQTVRFADCVGAVLDGGDHAFLEVGPGRTLATLSALHSARHGDETIATSLRHPDEKTDDVAQMLSALGRLWQGNVNLDWDAFYAGQRRRRVSLPTYAFDHASYWVDPGMLQNAGNMARPPVDQWFHIPAWVPAPPAGVAARGGVACVIAPREDLRDLATALSGRFDRVVEVEAARADDREFLRELATSSQGAVHFYFGAALTAAPAESHLLRLFNFVRALSEENCEAAALIVITRGAASLPGEEGLHNVGAAALNGASAVVASELQVPVAVVDIPAISGPREGAMLASEQPAHGSTPVLAYRGGRRYRRDYVQTSLTPSVPAIRDEGVYVITGGFGGLALALAQHLRSQKRVKLALIARSLPPEGAARDFYFAAGSRWKEALGVLEKLEGGGSGLMLLQADVSERDSLERVIAAVESRWGAINGVFHAAGSLADALLPFQDEQRIRRVLAPKIDGTINLTSLLSGRLLDFILLYSSTSAMAGIPGQFFYAGANAFLDAFAERANRNGMPVTAVAWDAWRDTGMTAALQDRQSSESSPIADNARSHRSGSAYRTILDGRDWVIDQHRTRSGIALLPGAGFVEIAYSAAEAMLPGTAAVGVRDLFLLQPLVLERDERVVISVVFGADGQFSIFSSRDADTADRGEWLAEHAQGRALRIPASGNERAIPLTSPANTEKFDGKIDHAQMDFGPRWHSVSSIAWGETEAVVRLHLREDFASDLTLHPLHPALFDMATGAAQRLVPDFDPRRDFYVPQSYGEVLVHAPLPPELVSHVRLSAQSSADTCVLDIDIADKQGTVLVEVRAFSMRRFAPDLLNGLRSIRASTADEGELQVLLQNAIRPNEGMAVLDRLLANPGFPAVLVTPRAPSSILYRRREDEAATAAANRAVVQHRRPNITSEYVAPGNELEKKLAVLWQEGLGIDAVGVHDNFFDLGGHSLLMIQLVNRARREAGVNLPLSKLYALPTIAGWATLVADRGSGAPPAPAKPALRRVSREAYQIEEEPR